MDIPIIDLIQLLILLGGVFWGVYRFNLESPHNPRMEFDVEAIFLEAAGDHYAAEYSVIATNKGLRKRSFEQIYLSVRGIEKESSLQEWKESRPRLLLPEKIFTNATLVHKKKYGSIFVEPGVTQRITYFSRIPKSIGIASIRAQFSYSENKSHSAEKLLQVEVKNA